MIRSGFIFDQGKCTGCKACVLACTIENGLAPDRSWRSVHTFNERYHPGLPVHHLSLACNHCDDPACMSACPAKAYDRDPVTGAVLIDAAKCIGCGYCSWACPYGAPRFDETIGVMTKCTFCNERQKEGRAPACVAQCPTGALQFGDTGVDGSSHKVPGLPVTTLGPALRIIGAGDGRPGPDPAIPGSGGIPFVPPLESIPRRVSLRKEWPLVVFTSAMSLLVATIAAGALAGTTLNPYVFVALAALAMLLSAAHLGKKLRAWRAILNLRESWLSREIFFTNAFVGAGFAYLLVAPDNRAVGVVAAAAGLAALFSIDMVYASLPQLGPRGSHSSGALLTGAFWTGIMATNPVLAGLAGAGKFYLYATRIISMGRDGRRIGPWPASLRIIVGLVIPALCWIASPGSLFRIVIAGALVGELVDRAQFYAELDVVTPERQMAADLERQVRDSIDRRVTAVE